MGRPAPPPKRPAMPRLIGAALALAALAGALLSGCGALPAQGMLAAGPLAIASPLPPVPASPTPTIAPTPSPRPTEQASTAAATSTARAAGAPIPAAAPSAAATTPAGARETPLLGTALGGVSLGMREVDVLRLLGEPSVRGVVHGQGGPQWTYADGLTVSIASPGGAVFQVAARAPFAGATREGFRLGQTEAQFRQRYAAFAIATPAFPPPQAYIRDSSGTVLSVLFDAGGHATTLILDNPAILCPDGCPVAVGSPGPAKGPR